jgi:hypothetical protein
MSRCLLLVALLLAMPGTASATEDWSVNQIAPPPQLIAGLSSFAVAPFEGPSGEQLAREIAGALTRGRGEFVPDHIDSNRGLSTVPWKVLDDPLRADAHMRGTVAASETVNSYTVQQTIRVDSEAWVTSPLMEGISVSMGTSVEVPVPCEQRDVAVSVSWDVVDAQGAVRAEGVMEASSAYQACAGADGRIRFEPFAARVAQVLVNFPDAVANQIAPFWRPMVANPGPQFDLDGDDWDEQETLGEVYCMTARLLVKEPYHDKALYLSGFLDEVYSNYDQAAVTYRRAVDATGHERSADGLRRVLRRMQEVTILKDTFGQALNGRPFACDLRPRARTRRKSKLMSEEDGGDVVVQLPDDMNLVVIDKGSGWSRVETPDGVVGWVKNSALRFER